MDSWSDIVGFILSFCKTIYQMAENVKANKERCQQVAQKVRSLEGLVLTIKEGGPEQISPTVGNALKELSATLSSAKTLMTKFSRTKSVMSFLKSCSHEEKFLKLDKRLNDNLHLLSGALLIQQGKVLHKVYDTVSGRTPTKPTVPLSSIMSPTPASSSTTPTSVPYIMYSMPSTSVCFSTTIASNSSTAPAMVNNFAMATQPVINFTGQMMYSMQNTSFVRTYAVNNSYFP